MTNARPPNGGRVHGTAPSATTGQPVEASPIQAMDADLFRDDALGEGTTDERSRYEIICDVGDFRDVIKRAPHIYLVVNDDQGLVIANVRAQVVREAGLHQAIAVQVPLEGEADEPTVEVDGTPVDRRALEAFDAETILRAAETVARDVRDEKLSAQLAELSPVPDVAEREMKPSSRRRSPSCATLVASGSRRGTCATGSKTCCAASIRATRMPRSRG